MKINLTMWKILFFIMLIIFLISLYGFVNLSDGDYSNSLLTLLSLLFFAVNILGIYGYVWKKKIISSLFWKFFFLTLIIFNIILSVIDFNEIFISTTDTIIVIIITILMYIPIYFYSFKSDNIWKNIIKK